MAMIRNGSQPSKGGPGTEWARLRARLRAVYVATGQERQTAVLDNHANREEYILRRLGVVCDADVDRISRKLGFGRS